MNGVFLLCGLPGAGKSTLIKEYTYDENNAVAVSRDKIRFSLDEAYFSHEDEVTKEFWKQINNYLKEGKIVFADQTSLTIRSRKYFLDHINEECDFINIIWVDEPLETCLERNEMRKGTRSYVPPDTIRRMATQFVKPSISEGFNTIYHYNSKTDKITVKETET